MGWGRAGSPGSNFNPSHYALNLFSSDFLWEVGEEAGVV